MQRSAEDAVANGLVGIAIQHLDDSGATQGIAGLRLMGSADRIRPGDAFMIGSTTKAMTAALAGRLVERGIIAWDTTVAEALPDLVTGMRPAYRAVTLEQLLAHRGGLLAFETSADITRFQTFVQSFKGERPDTLAGRERFFAAWLLAQDPPNGITPGRDYLYSNAGYALAALMLETRSGRAFGELFQQELATPLGMTVSWTAGTEEFRDRPVGHVGAKGKLSVIPPETADVAAWGDVLRAGGRSTTLSPDSYAIWVRWHLRALRGEATPLASGYLQRIKAMHTGDYSVGWQRGELNGRPLLYHGGEYRGFASLLLIDLQGRSASFAFTNTFPDESDWVLSLLNQSLIDVERALPPP